jgi:hypothetical protein
MITLNFSNVEELIFYDTGVQKQLPPHMFSLFEQWRLSKRVSYLKEIGKQAMLDFLNQISDEHVSILENYFEDKIIVERLNYNIVLNLEIPLEDELVCNKLCEIVGYNNLSTWRDDKVIYLSFWR